MQLISFLELELSQRKLPYLRLHPCPTAIQSMQDTGPAPLPPRTTVKGPSGPELPVGLIDVTTEIAPMLCNSHLSQVFLRAIPSKSPTGCLRVPFLFPRRPHLSRKSEWAGLVLIFWRPLEGAGTKRDGGRESLPAISLFLKVARVPLPRPGVPAQGKEAL